MGKMASLKCPRCQTEINADIPEPVIMNSPQLCIVGVAPAKISCPNPTCRTILTPIINQAQLHYRWMMLERPKEKSPLVVPAGGKLRGI